MHLQPSAGPRTSDDFLLEVVQSACRSGSLPSGSSSLPLAARRADALAQADQLQSQVRGRCRTSGRFVSANNCNA